MPKTTYYAGCYTPDEGDRGLLVFELDDVAGTLTQTGGVMAANPSFLQAANGRLYAACEQPDTARLCVFDTGDKHAPRPMAHADDAGAGTCHLAVWPDKTHVTLANYSSGSLFTVALDKAGKPCTVTQTLQFTGSGPDKERQEGPHAHAVYFAPGGQLVACDLGTDQLLVYTTAPDGTLTPNAGGHLVPLHPGAGPRHMAFHPNSRRAYVICELTCEVAVFDYHATSGVFSQRQVVSTLPEGAAPGSTGAEVAVSPDGRFLYASTRGANTIGVWRIDEADGTLAPVGNYDCGGQGPRHFTLAANGTLLVVANENSGDLALLSLDTETGAPRRVLDIAKAPHAVCVIPAEAQGDE